MMNVWDKFQEPAWQQAALRRGPPKEENLWAITRASDYDNKPMDTAKERRHKLKVKDWLFTNNLTEELLLNHPEPDAVKLLREIQTNVIWDYFNAKDRGFVNAINDQVILKRQVLKEQHKERLLMSVIRAQRLYKRQQKKTNSGK